MQIPFSLSFTTLLLLLATPSTSQRIIAQPSGLTAPDHVVDFGANVLPRFAPVSNQFPPLTITHARYFTTGSSNNLVGGFITNDPIGAPDTLVVRFAAPIHDVSFVYHQISTSRPSVFRALLGGTVVDTFSNLSDQFQSNNYFGWTNTVMDEFQIDFVADFNVDTIAFNDANASCTVRNGSGLNPVAFQCVSPPVVGGTWRSSITATPNTISSYIAVALGGPHPGLPFANGEILIQLAPSPVLVPGTGSFSLAIPNQPGAIGLQVATQGLRIDNVGPTTALVLLNALDLQFGI